MPFEVRPGVASALELHLARDLLISGVVRLPEGAPARPVWVRGLGLGDLAGIELAVESDADGAFRLGPLVPGEYRVLPAPEESLLCAPLELTAAAGSAGLELVLARLALGPGWSRACARGSDLPAWPRRADFGLCSGAAPDGSRKR